MSTSYQAADEHSLPWQDHVPRRVDGGTQCWALPAARKAPTEPCSPWTTMPGGLLSCQSSYASPPQCFTSVPGTLITARWAGRGACCGGGVYCQVKVLMYLAGTSCS